MIGDGEGLYLRIGSAGGKSWIRRNVEHGRRRDSGIGSASLMSRSEAREAARMLRKAAQSGADPDAFASGNTNRPNCSTGLTLDAVETTRRSACPGKGADRTEEGRRFPPATLFIPALSRQTYIGGRP